ncbi:DUF4232 domain-containing protein [Streptomyces sp. NPDC048389]|uniref:DUF4232 domain-containing protein n=1 Tax=Streptomyces sp. NPDC048389 TaxID=3154622 RepID=UPI003452A430
MAETIRRAALVAAAGLIAAGALSGCGGDSGTVGERAAASGSASASPGEGRDRDFVVEPDKLGPSDFARHGETPSPRATPVAPTPAACPESGAAVSTGLVDAAMGRRAVVVELVNCGTGPYKVNGYPGIGALDKDGDPLRLTVTHDRPYTDAGRDQGPKPLTLAPGESVKSVLNWNNRVTTFDAVTEGAYLVVTPKEGEPPQTLPFRLDIGTSGELDVTAWARDLLR